MKKAILTCALALGVLAVAAEIRTDHKGVKPIIAAPDLPPPDCWPDCPALSR
ncbi:MAG TPA: hypothetical protein VNX18_23055 [Bryobacteraceae bacterium]|jgi:hypothetical protein|nr:hypothetical protein [Bryobacteraceae bacterium]